MKRKKTPEDNTKDDKKKNPVTQKQTEFCKDHPQFMKLAKSARKAVKDDQKLGLLFMVNPLMAMKEMDPELNTTMKKRVKTAISKSHLNEGEKKLFEDIKEGKASIPWVKKVTFRKDKIADLIGE